MIFIPHPVVNFRTILHPTCQNDQIPLLLKSFIPYPDIHKIPAILYSTSMFTSNPYPAKPMKCWSLLYLTHYLHLSKQLYALSLVAQCCILLQGVACNEVVLCCLLLLSNVVSFSQGVACNEVVPCCHLLLLNAVSFSQGVACNEVVVRCLLLLLNAVSSLR